ncbi:peptidase M14 carboxypeptidase A [Halovivax asiaticus JCM 14624]|uniref:Peptidase M14 carboxypeptidase A n=1 Tax=Halovivax asiaticus JCM 14624 TaxID=1227490 RepID=M0BR42_9EURY|nr:M14 family zinc carboxypeptidase [Halovivax asiaticus]ELZ13471.1 peptidase M14 carboxypeptidase A [Halovivax asiaticus JCM 14624]
MSKTNHTSGESVSASESDRYTHKEAAALDEGSFDGSPIDRRTFMHVAAATGAALTLPGAVSATVEDDSLTELASFAVDATSDDHQTTLVIEFESVDALDAFYDLYGEPDWDIDEDDLPPKVATRAEPSPAAHAYLTADEVSTALAEIDGIESVDFSPGANPFWKLGDAYDDRVFPAVENARDYVSHGELAQGLSHLESTHPDRVRVHPIGESPGWENLFTGAERDPKDVYVAEVTKNVRDDASFQAKEKAVFSLAIHGDEPAGRVAGTRLIEEITKGEADGFEELIEDIAIVFIFTNPDGWVARKPQYEFESWSGTERVRYHRGNAAIGDTNRQYPTMGWINPSYWPAEPEDAPDVRPDDPAGRGYEDVVPDALSVVEHLRGYDNVEYLCDYHMMDLSASMVLNLESNAPYDHAGTHDLDEVNRRIDDAMTDHWGSPDAIPDETSRAAEAIWDYPGYVPDRLLDYGTIYDTLSYQVTGALLGWAGQPEEFGGLGAVTVAPELILRDAYDFKPFIERHLATAYRLSMREYAELTAASTDATVATGGKDVAYVSSDSLTRRSADLPFTDDHPGKGKGSDGRPSTSVHRRHDTVQPGPAGRSTVTASGSTRSLAVQVDAPDLDTGTVRLVDPEGKTVRKADFGDIEGRDDGAFYVPQPGTGEWSIEHDGGDALAVEFVQLDSDTEYPDPEAVLGYSQREYVVNPMQYFADLEPYLEDGSIDELRVHDVRNGRLMRGNSGKFWYDTVVISTDDGIDNPWYLAVLELFVATGGNLVLTDAGVALLGEIDLGEASAIDPDHISTETVRFPNLADRDFDHPLLMDVRPIQQEIWKVSQLGYTTGEDSPVRTVDADAFSGAGGSVAGSLGSSGNVGAGELTVGDGRITVLGSVLPPANQHELHPFGLADYTLSFMGHTLLCNALGFQQRRYVDGELVGTWGDIR